MDETPEELERIRREADAIDVHQYQKRFRALKAVGLGAAAAGVVWLVLILRNGVKTASGLSGKAYSVAFALLLVAAEFASKLVLHAVR